MSSRRLRQGFTLLEMLAVLGGLLAIGMAATRLLHRVSQVGQQTAQTEFVISQVERLADDFRRDIRQCESLSVTDEQSGEGMEIDMGGLIVKYSVKRNPLRIERTEGRGQGESEQGESTLRSDSYPLAETCQPRFFRDGMSVGIDLTGERPGPSWIIQGKQSP